MTSRPPLTSTASSTDRRASGASRRFGAAAAAGLAALLLAGASEAQRQLSIETSEGSFTIEASDHPDLQPFVSLFFGSQMPLLRGGLFHRSNKLIACNESNCVCADAYDCTPCENVLAPDPELTCLDGEAADCACEDLSTPSFLCTAGAGAQLTCADMEPPVCTCDDQSIPSFLCEDGSDPPGRCTSGQFIVTDLTIRAGALYAGSQRLDGGQQVLDVADYMPGSLATEPGIFQNNDLTVAFVRDPVSCLLTSEWIINLQDNSETFDDVGCGGGPGTAAYLVFARVVGAVGALDTIARLATFDLVNDLSCGMPPAPLNDWITGVPDSLRCNADWQDFPLGDFSFEPVPRVLGNCAPGDTTCMCPQGMQPCTERSLALCEQEGTPVVVIDENGDEVEQTPCLVPVCDDTQTTGPDLECSEPLGANFPTLVPEPGPAPAAAAALATLAALWRRRPRRQHDPTDPGPAR